MLFPRTARIKKALGNHDYAESPHCLTLPDLGALVITAGCEAGFIVKVEVPVRGLKGTAKLDCVWCALDGKTIVAWEFDGRDVNRSQIQGSEKLLGNRVKFQRSGALLKVQALYSLRREAMLDPQSGATDLMKPDVETIADEQFMCGGIESIARRAVDLAGNRGLVPQVEDRADGKG